MIEAPSIKGVPKKPQLPPSLPSQKSTPPLMRGYFFNTAQGAWVACITKNVIPPVLLTLSFALAMML